LTPSENLFEILERLSQNQSGIRLLNIYKGLPISYDATISSLGDSEIHVISNKYQISCLYHQRETFIRSEDLPFVIRSQVISLNLAKEDAVLANFEMAQNSIGNRMNIRVEPEEHLVGSIQFKGLPTKVMAAIADISIHGASIYIEDFLFPVRLFQPGNEISMSILIPEILIQKTKKTLTSQIIDSRNVRSLVRSGPPFVSDGNIEINAWGKILAVRPELHANRYRVSVKLFIKDQERAVVSQYISQRQTEIIRDLRILSEELFKRRK
jgi:hypothetical protein